MRLIDADALIDEIKHRLWDWESVDGITATTVLKQTITDIENQPTVLLKEQQEIVRCEDCQFHYAGENEVDAWDRCRLHSINTEPDNYCSWAVK